MRVGHIEIFVTDPTAARKFYEDVLGLEVSAVQGDRFVWLRSGGVEVLLRPGRVARSTASYDASSVAIVLYTPDLAGAKAELRSRGVVFRGTDGADDCPTFTDPDGNWFQLVDPSSHT